MAQRITLGVRSDGQRPDADQRTARAEIVEKVHELLLAGLRGEGLGAFEEELIRAFGLAVVGDDTHAGLRGLILDGGEEIDPLILQRDGGIFPSSLVM